MPRLKEYPAVFSRGQTIGGVKYNKGDPHPAAGLNTNKFKVDGTEKAHWRTKKPKVKGKLAKAKEERGIENIGFDLAQRKHVLDQIPEGDIHHKVLKDPNYIFSKEVGDFVDSQLIDYLPDDEIQMPYRRRAKQIEAEEDTELKFTYEKMPIDSVDDPHFTNTMLKQMGSGSSSSRTIGGNVIGMNQRKYLAIEKLGGEDYIYGMNQRKDKDIKDMVASNAIPKHRLADLLSTKTGKARERGLRADYGFTQTQWKQKKEFEAMISGKNIAEAVAKTQQSPPPQMLGPITPLAVSHSIEPNLQPILKQDFYTDKEGKKYDKKLFKPKLIVGKGMKYVKR